MRIDYRQHLLDQEQYCLSQLLREIWPTLHEAFKFGVFLCNEMAKLASK